ncbi:hypothetical protein GYMLUDRAFT_63714 [Collybiopsis luxurians FD-317 M1]|uniref:Uncharacterized protein n=1 Tax=Collybiopsis luxurians FD-317 M1 TaxID=944289 RepID=A0A0D0BFP4_9AGAR|nr:hypothetical protein GYMLUDRAFT_63714 [Collybiopsis luxurians FD-317 M1]
MLRREVARISTARVEGVQIGEGSQLNNFVFSLIFSERRKAGPQHSNLPISLESFELPDQTSISSELTDLDGSGEENVSDADLATPVKGQYFERETYVAGVALDTTQTDNQMEIEDRVGEILDTAMGRRTSASPLPGKIGNIFSGSGLSEEAKNLMIGWRYVQHWRNHGSPNSDIPGGRLDHQPDSLAPAVIPVLGETASVKRGKKSNSPVRDGHIASSVEDCRSREGESLSVTFLAESAIPLSHIQSFGINPMSSGGGSITSAMDLDAALSFSDAPSHPMTPQHSQIDDKCPLTTDALTVASQTTSYFTDPNGVSTVTDPPLTKKHSNDSPQKFTSGSLQPTTDNITNPPSSRGESASRSQISTASQKDEKGSLSPLQAPKGLSTVLSSDGESSTKMQELMKIASEMGLTLIDFNGSTVKWTPEDGTGDVAMSEVISEMKPLGQESLGQSDTKGKSNLTVKWKQGRN